MLQLHALRPLSIMSMKHVRAHLPLLIASVAYPIEEGTQPIRELEMVAGPAISFTNASSD